jgi:ABC-type phosphate transport system substrate-binding protein
MSRYQGTSLEPVDQERGSTVRETFSEAIHGRSVNAIKSYWQRQIFSGRETPPPELGSDAEVVNHVNSNAGGIGYVSVGTALNGAVQVQVVD